MQLNPVLHQTKLQKPKESGLEESPLYKQQKRFYKYILRAQQQTNENGYLHTKLGEGLDRS